MYSFLCTDLARVGLGQGGTAYAKIVFCLRRAYAQIGGVGDLANPHIDETISLQKSSTLHGFARICKDLAQSMHMKRSCVRI